MTDNGEFATNGHLATLALTPQEAFDQVLKLADTLGYYLVVVALTAKTKTPVPIIEYLPDGVEVQFALVRKPSGHDPLLPA